MKILGIDEICGDPYGVESLLFMVKKGSQRDAVDGGPPFAA